MSATTIWRCRKCETPNVSGTFVCGECKQDRAFERDQDAVPQPTASPPDNSSIESLLIEYARLQESIIDYRQATFPGGTKVIVNGPGRYRGPGIAVNDSSVPADKCAVALGNGNTWWYDLLNVTPAPTPEKGGGK